MFLQALLQFDVNGFLFYTQSMHSHIAVVGMGAIGCLYASKLKVAPVKLTCISATNHDVLTQKGLTVIAPNGEQEHVDLGDVFSSLTEVSDPLDYIVICTKVLPQCSQLNELKDIMKPETAVVLLQNGIGIESDYINAFPQHILISGVAFVCAQKTAPATVHHQDFGRLVLGRYPKGNCERTKTFANYFKYSDISCFQSENMLKERYKKLVWNIPFNPLSVITKGKNTLELLAIPGMEARINNIMKEVQRVARSQGVEIEDEVLVKNITETKKMVPYKTSMCLDWERGGELETEAIVGNFLKIAKKADIDIPEIKKLYEELILS